MKNVAEKHGSPRRGKHSFGLAFTKWQDSSLGKYVEFEIRVNYLEGSQSQMARRGSMVK